MRRLVLAALFLSSSAVASKPGESETLVRREFKDLSVRQQKDAIVLEVCFDLCDVFQWRGSPQSEAAWDFVAAYEYKRGVGTESRDFIAKGKALVQAAAKRMASHCREDSSDVDAPFDCSWAELARSRAIRVGTSIYDEGERCFGWYDLTSNARPTRPNCRPVKGVPWKLNQPTATRRQ
jgi:hypothetical protein